MATRHPAKREDDSVFLVFDTINAIVRIDTILIDF